MNLENNYWYFKKALSKPLVNRIIEICEESKKKDAEIEGSVLDKKKRDCLISWVSSQTIYKTLNPYINTANENAGWNFDISWNEDCQYTIYNKKQFYGYHIDSFIKPYKDCQNKNWEGKYRKLSLTLQLSDPSEYEGGDFYFKYLTSEGVKEEKVDDAKDFGTIIIFPSFVYHQVTPITKGTRKSLVNWSLGFPFK
jgi:PKHD-type hydroxylase